MQGYKDSRGIYHVYEVNQPLDHDDTRVYHLSRRGDKRPKHPFCICAEPAAYSTYTRMRNAHLSKEPVSRYCLSNFTDTFGACFPMLRLCLNSPPNNLGSLVSLNLRVLSGTSPHTNGCGAYLSSYEKRGLVPKEIYPG